MTPDVNVKICGLKDTAGVEAAVDAGARYLGFNFFAPSPRYVQPEDVAMLAEHVPVGVAKVGLVVDFDDLSLDQITAAAPLDMIQLHGHETPERVADIKKRYGLPVIKAIGVEHVTDLDAIQEFGAVADQLLIDTKAPVDAELPGGNGIVFDWSLAKRKFWPVPWMLAGGLTPKNVGQAIEQSGARQVDVSSGVEVSRGVKDAVLIKQFINAAVAG